MSSLPAAAAADKPRAPLLPSRGPSTRKLDHGALPAAAAAPCGRPAPGGEGDPPGPFDRSPPLPGGLDPRGGGRQWAITPAGASPESPLARDCLHGPLHRNRLASWSRNYARQPPPWVTGLTDHLPPGARAQAVQHVALHYQHLRRLALLADDEAGGLSLGVPAG